MTIGVIHALRPGISQICSDLQCRLESAARFDLDSLPRRRLRRARLMTPCSERTPSLSSSASAASVAC